MVKTMILSWLRQKSWNITYYMQKWQIYSGNPQMTIVWETLIEGMLYALTCKLTSLFFSLACAVIYFIYFIFY